MKLIKDIALLREDYRSDDLFDIKKSKDAIGRRLSELSPSSSIAIVGRFGSGKSTTLYQLEKECNDNEIWLHFDAWKYPDRGNLWEGLVLDIADQIGRKKGTVRKIDGNVKAGKIVDVVSDIASLASGIPGLNIFDKLLNVFKSSPAKRVFEIQEILKDLLSVTGGVRIYLVIEDIDRSGDAGVYFLETLNHFLKNVDIDNDVVAIVPISDESYTAKIDSYLKCIDYFEFFRPDIKDMKKFVSAVFDDDLFKGELRHPNNQIIWTGKHKLSQLTSFLEMLFTQYSDINGRKLKLIIRDFNATYSLQSADGHEPDWRVTLCVQAMKYLKEDGTSSDENAFNKFIRQGSISKSSIFGAYLYAIYRDVNSLTEFDHSSQTHKLNHSPTNFKLVARSETQPDRFPSYPYITGGSYGDRQEFALCDFYFRY